MPRATDKVKDPQPQRADSVGDIGDICSKIFNLEEMCKFPLYVQPRVAREWFAPWEIICTPRMGHFQWELTPRRERMDDVHPASGAYWPPKQENLDHFRRCWLRARASPLSETMGPISLDDGSVLEVPSDDESIPVEQHIPLSLRPPN